MVIFRLGLATALPVILSALLQYLDRKTAFGRVKGWKRQGMIGVLFGLLAIFSTEFGVPAGDGVVINVRDAAPLCAGLFFGAPAGFLAGLIGSVHRWMCTHVGVETITRTACCTTTFLAGVFSGLMRRKLFDDHNAGFLSALGTGATVEVLHMLLVLATNLKDVTYAFSFVQKCTYPMIFCNAASVGLAALVIGFSEPRESIRIRRKRISRDFGFWLLVCVVIAFLVSSGFTHQVICQITSDETVLVREVTLYLVAFMEILIYSALFILIYEMLKKKVIRNLQKVNDGLNAITNGNLDTVVDARAFYEFSELSDDVNATVSTLKKYIQEAERRIDQELEFARQIQRSALPSVFPPYPNRPDFDLYATMDPAKEVGGDFYDFYLIDRFTLVFMIADVSGKGIPAALFMMRAKTQIKGLAESGKSVSDIFNIANQKLCQGNDAGMFITAWMGRLDLRTGRLEYVNAGHNPPLIARRNGKFEYLRSKPNFILAGMDISKYRAQEIQLNPGDQVFLYTDGVTEAMDVENRLYGEGRLERCMEMLSGKHPKDVCAAVKRSVQEFAGKAAQADDITMLSLRVNALNDKNRILTYPDGNSVNVVRQYLQNRLEGANFSEKAQQNLLDTVEAVWANIVLHGNMQSSELLFQKDGNTVTVWVNYAGVPYDLTQEIALDLSRAKHTEYAFADDQNQLEITFDMQ